MKYRRDGYLVDNCEGCNELFEVNELKKQNGLYLCPECRLKVRYNNKEHDYSSIKNCNLISTHTRAELFTSRHRGGVMKKETKELLAEIGTAYLIIFFISLFIWLLFVTEVTP